MITVALVLVVFLLVAAPAVLAKIPMSRAGRAMVTGRPFDPFDPRRPR